ncbi:MAG: fibrillarin-like rRNA/tRNA 2'-O-methyltransferase [Candidatus Bathyarchaeota archaeon]|nr:MAG: fibrillarin-like rRNA/tRNA 2'-O-methyltransferase [Candidatus Bathyarchaeota archaeon]
MESPLQESLIGERSVAGEVKPHPHFPGIYKAYTRDGSERLATRNLTPGRSVYSEKLIKHEGVEYRLWDPFRSKLAAAILNGLETVPIQPGHKILYLGAASGTTASHVSDLVKDEGHVYCVEFAPRAMRELVNNVCAYRINMSPILADARLPERYSTLVGKVDDIYCDIAQPQQAKILADNAELYLRDNGWMMLMVKARSINVTKEPSAIYEREIDTLKARGFQIREVVHLEPYDKAHATIVAE